MQSATSEWPRSVMHVSSSFVDANHGAASHVAGFATIALHVRNVGSSSAGHEMFVSLARQAELMLRQVPQMESENQQLRSDLSTMPLRTLPFCGGNVLQIE